MSAEDPTNRREHYRIWTPRLAAEATSLRNGRARRLRVRVVDLSGGGALIVAGEPLNADGLLRLHLPPGRGLSRFDATARIVRLRDRAGAWQAALSFTGLSEAQRDLIVRRVFFEELRHVWRESRRCGLVPEDVSG